jgi:hypothetical protein
MNITFKPNIVLFVYLIIKDMQICEICPWNKCIYESSDNYWARLENVAKDWLKLNVAFIMFILALNIM